VGGGGCSMARLCILWRLNFKSLFDIEKAYNAWFTLFFSLSVLSLRERKVF
jgi:hypothetical protein